MLIRVFRRQDLARATNPTRVTFRANPTRVTLRAKVTRVGERAGDGRTGWVRARMSRCYASAQRPGEDMDPRERSTGLVGLGDLR